MDGGETGFQPFSNIAIGEHSSIAYAPIGDAGWSVGVVFPEPAVTRELRTLRHHQLAIGAIGFGLLLAIAVAVARSISRPVTRLETAARGRAVRAYCSQGLPKTARKARFEIVGGLNHVSNSPPRGQQTAYDLAVQI
jgi:hypothetical protein